MDSKSAKWHQFSIADLIVFTLFVSFFVLFVLRTEVVFQVGNYPSKTHYAFVYINIKSLGISGEVGSR